jgi:regulator of sigma E protease
MVGDAANIGFSYTLGFIALISINLAVLNLLPFPALDGGRILFIFIESIFRRKINPAIENALNFAGFAILIVLMVIVTYHDLLRIF